MKESGPVDVSVPEEQGHQMLNEPSQASSPQQGDSSALFSNFKELLNFSGEEDDATFPSAAPRHEPNHQSVQVGEGVVFQATTSRPPQCALWCCTMPAHGSGTDPDYCCALHAVAAIKNGQPSMRPVQITGGFVVQDVVVFSALSAKALKKDVGIPVCEGAATAKAPWKAPELFDSFLPEGETTRECLFFGERQGASNSGNRKQRSLRDNSGRWHQSGKVKMNGGRKTSFYMDPQPPNSLDWYLHEYEINGYDDCVLYRLELKKIANGSVAALHKQNERLFPNLKSGNKRSVTGRLRVNAMVGVGTEVDDTCDYPENIMKIAMENYRGKRGKLDGC